MKKESKIYVAGHRGLVGSAIMKSLLQRGYENLVFRTHDELDLISQNAVEIFFKQEMPDYVILAAAKVGGIMANNTYRADFIYEKINDYGHNVDIVIRPEALILSKEKSPLISEVNGVVVESKFIGNHAIVHMTVSDSAGEKFHMHSKVPGDFLPEPASSVSIELDNRHIFIFSRI